MNKDLLTTELIRDEGVRLNVYDDATGLPIRPGSTVKGHPTIGIGRALDVRGLTPDEAQYLLSNDIDAFTLGLQQAYTWFNNLDDSRQRVLVNMAFNLGLAGLAKFPEMLEYLADGRYGLAASAMEDSLWYREVGQRAVRLVAMMRNGG